MKLVLAAHWTDDDGKKALDDLAKACAPLKAEGTVGLAVALEGADAIGIYNQMKEWSER